ncbi:MAG: AEC family transporter [Thermoproteota archaeon]|nr:AEC family transporter [Candidatus Brockarchaeota archaeon]
MIYFTGFLNIILFLSAGFLFRKLNLINEKEISLITRIVIYILLPFSALKAFMKSKVSENFLKLAFFGLSLCLLELLLIFIFLRNNKNLSKGEKSIMIVASSSMNTGLFGLPFFETFYGNSGVATALLMDIGNSIYLFMIAYAILSIINEEKSRSLLNAAISGLKAIVTMPYVWGLAIGIVLSTYSVTNDQFYNFVSLAASFTSPLVLIATGASLTKLSINLKKTKPIWITKFALGIFLGYFLITILGFQGVEKKVAVLFSALPPPFMTVIYADLFRLDVEFASQIVTFGLFLGFILFTVIVNLL